MGKLTYLICGVALATSLLLAINLILSSYSVSILGGIYMFTLGAIFSGSISFFLGGKHET